MLSPYPLIVGVGSKAGAGGLLWPVLICGFPLCASVASQDATGGQRRDEGVSGDTPEMERAREAGNGV